MTQHDWSKYMEEAQAGASVPAGNYDVRVSTAKVAATQNGKDMFKLSLEILSGPYAGKKVYDQLVISPESPGAMKFFFGKMGTLGASHEFFAQRPSNDQIVAQISNQVCTVTVSVGEWNGVPRNDIDSYLPYAGGGAAAPVAQAAAAPVPVAAQPAPTPIAVAPAPTPIPAASVPVAIPEAQPAQNGQLVPAVVGVTPPF